MGRKELAALAALACVATPGVAFDGLNQSSPGMMFYFSVPLDGRSPKEQAPAYGLMLQGKRYYETVRLDSRMINNFTGGVIETKFIIAGVVAAGAAVAVASKDKKRSDSYEQQQQQQQQQQLQNGQEPCPATPSCP